MRFNIKDLPYAQFEQLGMSRKDVITMPPDELANMLNGGRTGLLALKIELGQGLKPIQTEAKLSLTRNPDNTLSIGVHPILAKPTNTIEATPEQWENLLKGVPIIKDSKTFNGSVEPHIFQLDRDTNEILSARVNAIQIPNSIKDVVLSPSQNDQLMQGKLVEIVSKDAKESFVVRLDLNESRGYKITFGEVARTLLQEMKLSETGAEELVSIKRGIKM